MTEASVTSDAENVKPRIEEPRKDSTEVSSGMENVKHRMGKSREDSAEVTSRDGGR